MSAGLPALRTRPLPPVVMPTRSTAQLALLPPVRPKSPWLGMLVVAMLAANLVLYVLTVVQEASLNRLQSQILGQRQQNVRLRASLATAQSPDRIEAEAMARLNMVRSEHALYLPSLPLDHPTHRVRPPAFGVREAY